MLRPRRTITCLLMLLAAGFACGAKPEATPGPENSSAVTILEELCKALRENYPMLEYAGAPGDAWFEEFRPRVAVAPDPETAYGLMDELVCRLNDYHTRLFVPNQAKLASPPIRLEVVASDKAALPLPVMLPLRSPPIAMPNLQGYAVAVTEAAPGTALAVGDEVLAVENRPVAERLAQLWKHSRGSSAAAKLREACWRMLLGSPDNSVELSVRSAQGDTRTVRLNRTGEIREPVVSSRLVSGVAVLRISAWSNDKGMDLVAEFSRLLEQYRNLRGIVFDVRGNGGGQDDLADAVTARFLQKPVISSISFLRRSGTLTFDREVKWAKPSGAWRFPGRVAVLTDEGCRSSCEHFVSGMAEAGALLCGTRTDGACGWMRMVSLPGGLKVRVSRTFPIHTGGLPSPLAGIEPHLWRPKTLKDLQSGRDAALRAAIDWVRGDEPVPARTW